MTKNESIKLSIKDAERSVEDYADLDYMIDNLGIRKKEPEEIQVESPIELEAPLPIFISDMEKVFGTIPEYPDLTK